MLTPLHRFNNDMVFVDGRLLRSVGWEGELDGGSFYIDYDTGYVYIGTDPKDRLVEITAFDVALLRTSRPAHGKPNDRKGPLTLAVAVEAKLREMGLQPAGDAKVEDTRLVVFGTPLFADNRRFFQLPLNGDLFLNAVGWLVGQEESVTIRMRTMRSSRAELSVAEQEQLFYWSILILPELLIAIGIGVWWRRRSG